MNEPQNTHGGKRAGAGRPAVHPEGTAKNLSVSVPGALVEKLDKLAGRWEVSRSSALSRILREYGRW